VTKVFLTTYYMLNTYILYSTGYFFLNYSHQTLNYTMFARPIAFLPSSDWTFPTFFIAGLFALGLCIFQHHIIIRSIAAILFLVLFSMKFSFGKINHSQHVWMIASVLMCFILKNKPMGCLRNLYVLRIIQSVFSLSLFYIWALENKTFRNFQLGASST